jgi:hypothetical protein
MLADKTPLPILDTKRMRGDRHGAMRNGIRTWYHESSFPRMVDLSGLRLAELFYREAVKPILDAHFLGLRYSAALVGPGSEVLGFDTDMSRDHHWGPRVMIFVSETDFAAKVGEIREVLSRTLPATFCGYSTNFSEPDRQGVQCLEEAKGPRINHRVEFFTIDGFFRKYLGFDLKQSIDVADWLTFPQQKLRTIACGAIFHDDLGLADICGRFSYYPHDVWLYQLAAHWSAIGEEEPFVGRTGDLGDEVGSALIAARMVQQLMGLCFLMERQYAPYSKWFGTAFGKLGCGPELMPILKSVLSVQGWREREKALSAAYEFVAQLHNRLNITAPLPAKVSPFHGRPFLVIQGGDFANTIRRQIQDERVRRISTNVGGIDVFSTSTNLLEATILRERLKSLYI